MLRSLITFLVLVCVINLATGCHWFRGFGRKKRSTAAEAAESRVWRNYFAQCMFSKVSSYSWTSPVDFTILQSVWYVDIDQWKCSSAGGQDTGSCWKSFIDGFLQSPISGFAKTCIDEYESDVSSNLLRYDTTNGRKKRSVASQPTQPQSNYSRCLQNNAGTIPGTDPIDFETLTEFVRKYTVFGCEACGGECSANEAPLPSDAPPQWPYKLLALTRTDAPIRNAVAVCNDQFFPGNPFWSTWSSWNPACAHNCESPGVQSRSRTCRSGVTPTRAVDASECGGSAAEQRPFNFPPGGCRLPYWANWEPWTPECPECGQQVRSRSRKCSCGYDSTIDIPCNCCPGEVRETEQALCPISPCPPPAWTPWSPWGPSCPNCGVYELQNRNRTCKRSHGLYEELPYNNCPGNHQESRPCDMQPCLPPAWTAWGSWYPSCPQCGNYQAQNRNRTCRQRHPLYEDVPYNNCPGPYQDRGVCNIQPCQPPSWAPWGAWYPPCLPCGGVTGSQTRNRSCKAAYYPFEEIQSGCYGQPEEYSYCSSPPCFTSIWGPWDPWSPQCPPECFPGEAKQSRGRICLRRQVSGSSVLSGPCFGNALQNRNCPSSKCDFWEPWQPWSPQNCPCGDGLPVRVRRRVCRTTDSNNHSPSCPGPDVERKGCEFRPCQDVSIYQWTNWGRFGPCRGPCRNQTQLRARECRDLVFNFKVPDSACGAGPAKERKPCSGPCWTNWSNWTSCNVEGRCTRDKTRQRSRRCIKGILQLASRQCSPGFDSENEPCRCNYNIRPQK